MQLWTSSNKSALLTVRGSGDPKTRNKEAKTEKGIPFLVPQFRKPTSSNLSADQPKSQATWWLHPDSW